MQNPYSANDSFLVIRAFFAKPEDILEAEHAIDFS
jgi:hypothetical protein